jgi:hypothetical protein
MPVGDGGVLGGGEEFDDGGVDDSEPSLPPEEDAGGLLPSEEAPELERDASSVSSALIPSSFSASGKGGAGGLVFNQRGYERGALGLPIFTLELD